MPQPSPKTLLRRCRSLLSGIRGCRELSLQGTVPLGSRRVRLPRPNGPLRFQRGDAGGTCLELQPEVLLTADGGACAKDAFLLFDPERYFHGIDGFLRLEPGSSLLLEGDDPLGRDLASHLAADSGLRLSIGLGPDGLVIKDKAPAAGTRVSCLSARETSARLAGWRLRKLERLTQLLPGLLLPLPRREAYELITEVNELMERDAPCQGMDRNGKCGGVAYLPDNLTPVFVGDLHARIDNLLVVLTQNGFLEALEAGTAGLVLLGDAVHPDAEGQEARMESSMLMMDIVFRLKLAFPRQVFYLRGNHDSFSEDISKAGVPQGLLWEQALHEARGAAYARAMARFYDSLPYVLYSPRVLACHAGPPRGKVSLDRLENIRQHPGLMREITHIRLQRPSLPSGYSRGDVRRLRKRLDLEPDTPFIVGHTPLSSTETLWLNAGGIPHHHVLFGAHPEWVGVIALMDGHLLPLQYPAEPLQRVFNWLVSRDDKRENTLAGSDPKAAEGG